MKAVNDCQTKMSQIRTLAATLNTCILLFWKGLKVALLEWFRNSRLHKHGRAAVALNTATRNFIESMFKQPHKSFWNWN